ncbi:LacI family transcriptional regulator [Devosia epidermidihirudinis]|uniref:LacI family transcriptional regulator n=2 Tax=Devosia epidermidihirudinis TaxID=1293439 RepID=A0A0F5QBD6_9HYPH|nr:LacI family transcriptional regulator [Devosia epidermidihirudinis]
MLTASGSAFAQDKYDIAMICKGFQHQFWQAVKAGAEKAGAEFGATITFEGPETESQVDRQMDMLAAALSRGPDAIGFAALDSQAAIPLLQQASAAGIPIIAFDSGVDSDIPLSTATTDNVAAAALAADKMAELIGNSGKIAVVAHDQTSRTGIDRVEGFTNRIKEAHPNVEVVTVQYGAGDQLASTEITKSILLANPDLKGIFGANEGSAIGVANGKQELNSNVVVIGFDSGAAQKAMVASGLMNGSITQNPVGIGYETVKAAVAALKGETVPKIVDTGFYYYDAANMNDPEIAAVLYD